MEVTEFWNDFGANWNDFKENWTDSNISSTETPSENHNLPSNLTDISDNSLLGVFAYGVVFLLAVVGHIFVIASLWKRYKVKKTRIFLLLLHLSLADLIVCLIIVPTEIFWRLSVQWQGGNFLCKATQFFRAFGLYLSSLVLICLSLDRFISIIFPLKAIGEMAYKRIKRMIATAWIAAALFAIPQIILFSVESHPKYPDYWQCVTSSFDDEENFKIVKVYSIFSLVVMYFFPLVVIAFTYTTIFFKLTLKSHEQRTYSASTQSDTDIQRENSMSTVVNEAGEVAAVGRSKTKPQLRSSRNAQVNLTKAKMRTLWMTIVIVVAFVVCWTPYAVMTLWYIMDWEEAEKVDARIQDAFFLMVVSNSCFNPIIYGGFSHKSRVRNSAMC